MEIPWSSDSRTEPSVEHFQHLEDEPASQNGEEEGGGGGEEDEEVPARYPCPFLWEVTPDYY